MVIDRLAVIAEEMRPHKDQSPSELFQRILVMWLLMSREAQEVLLIMMKSIWVEAHHHDLANGLRSLLDFEPSEGGSLRPLILEVIENIERQEAMVRGHSTDSSWAAHVEGEERLVPALPHQKWG